MARVNIDDLDKYSGGSGGVSFFKLSKNKDTAQVRFLLDKPEDISDYLYSVHSVKYGDAKWPRDVNCLRSYNEPLDECPFCASGLKPSAKLYIPLYNLDAEEVQIWARGRGFIPKFQSFITRYSKPSIVSQIVEIERNGEENDKKTTYELYPIDKDDASLDEFGDIPEILGNALADKSFEDMEYYLDNEDFPSSSDSEEDEDEKPVRRGRQQSQSTRRSRRVEAEEEDAEEEEEQPRRRHTETSNSRRRTSRRTPSNEEDY